EVVLVLSEEDAKKNRFWFFVSKGTQYSQLLWVHGCEVSPVIRTRLVTGELAQELTQAKAERVADDLKVCLRFVASATELLPSDGYALWRQMPVFDRLDGRLRALISTSDAPNDAKAALLEIRVLDQDVKVRTAGRLSPRSYDALFQPRKLGLLPMA